MNDYEIKVKLTITDNDTKLYTVDSFRGDKKLTNRIYLHYDVGEEEFARVITLIRRKIERDVNKNATPAS